MSTVRTVYREGRLTDCAAQRAPLQWRNGWSACERHLPEPPPFEDVAEAT